MCVMGRCVSGGLLVPLICLLHSGCLTQRTYQRFEASAIESGWIELVEANSSSVRLRVSIEYEGALRREGMIEFDPRLGGCATTRIVLRTEHEDVRLAPGERHSLTVDERDRDVPDPMVSERETSNGLPPERPGECTVAILSSIYGDDVSLAAANLEGNLGGVLIPSPKNVWVLALLLPATAAIDVATFVPRIIVKCFSGAEEAAACAWIGAIVSGGLFQSGG